MNLCEKGKAESVATQSLKRILRVRVRNLKSSFLFLLVVLSDRDQVFSSLSLNDMDAVPKCSITLGEPA